MAVSVLRISLGKLPFLGGNIAICQPCVSKVLHFQTASISSKATRSPTNKPAPWPYKEKKFTFWHGFFEDTKSRFDENSKIILVEGNLGTGKSAFAEALAKDLDMHFIPEPTMDLLYINKYGFDIRTLDPLLPESCKSCDIKTFYQDPHNVNVARFQLQMYALRFEQYIDALAHLFSTGQGVVLDRSVFSDYVFAETMHKFGYLSKGALSFYNEMKANTIGELLRPHLVIYLDVPSTTILDRIKKRNLPHEANSKVLTNEYIENIEYYYKQDFLKDISQHSELLIYDWSNYGDVEVVCEDIERIDFDRYDKHDLKLRDWNKIVEKWHWHGLRRLYTNEKHRLMLLLNIPRYDVPELVISGDDAVMRTKVLDDTPALKYASGFNEEAGEKGLLFKLGLNYREAQLAWRESAVGINL